MKIKSNYVLKTIGDNIIVVPLKEEALRFNGIISLNKTGKFLFESLQNNDLTKEDLLNLVLEKYEVSHELAKHDIDEFIEKCMDNNLFYENSI